MIRKQLRVRFVDAADSRNDFDVLRMRQVKITWRRVDLVISRRGLLAFEGVSGFGSNRFECFQVSSAFLGAFSQRRY